MIANLSNNDISYPSSPHSFIQHQYDGFASSFSLKVSYDIRTALCTTFIHHSAYDKTNTAIQSKLRKNSHLYAVNLSVNVVLHEMLLKETIS